MPRKKSDSDPKVRAPEVERNLAAVDEVQQAQEVTPPPVPAPPADPAPSEQKPQVDKEKLLSFIEQMIDTLTFKRVGLIGLLVAVGLILFSVWENRTSIVEKITQPQAQAEAAVAAWTLSDNSKSSLERLARQTSVNFIVVTDVDLQKNRKTIRYMYIDDPTIKLTQEQSQALSLPQAVFDYDAKNTAQMVSILSNEFRCDVYKETIYFRYAPELEQKIPTVCRMAIPPFVGQFVGFLTVGISKQPTKQELDTIRLEVSRLAVEIYLNDVIKKPPIS